MDKLTWEIIIVFVLLAGALFGFGISVLFWILTYKTDNSKSPYKEEEKPEYDYEFWFNEGEQPK